MTAVSGCERINFSRRAAQSRQRNHCGRIVAARAAGCWIVAGCLVQTVWNRLTTRAVDYGINDYDVFYFEPIRHGPPRTP
jgi:hypothetical protein